jgi:beta-glucanase (GH16 family)
MTYPPARGTFILCTILLAALPAAPAQTPLWSDEFNGTAVDPNNWEFMIGDGCAYGNCGWGNNELEYYTNGNNSSIQNGVLVIEARRENVGGMAYTSSRMITRGKHEFTYGKIEARMALPMGQGLWPAFWMLGSNIGSVGWPACGETDIMEHINATNTVYGTIHWDAGGYASYGGSTNTTPANYHVYTIEWTSSYIRWFVDGVQYHEANSINGTDEFHRPFFILLNLAVGGNWPGSPNSSTPFPSRMYVDYVRVYQQGTTPPPPPSGISTTAWYQVINQNSNLCLDDDAWGTANGAKLIQWPCGAGQFNQQWQFTPTSGGYYNIKVRYAPSLVIDVSDVSTANSAKVHLWTWVGGNNQQWIPESMGNGYYRFRARHSGRCLDVPGASTANAIQLQQYDCNGTAAQSFRLAQQ